MRITRIPSLAKTSSKTPVNFLSRSRIRNRNPSSVPATAISRACWATHDPVGCRVIADQIHAPSLDLDEEQHLRAVRRIVSTQKKSQARIPAAWDAGSRARSARRWLQPEAKHDPADGGRRDCDRKLGEFATDPLVAPNVGSRARGARSTPASPPRAAGGPRCDGHGTSAFSPRRDASAEASTATRSTQHGTQARATQRAPRRTLDLTNATAAEPTRDGGPPTSCRRTSGSTSRLSSLRRRTNRRSAAQNAR